MADYISDSDEEEILLKKDTPDIQSRICSLFKLTAILFSFGFAFVSLVQWGGWISDVSTYDPSKQTNFLDWVDQISKNGLSWNSDFKSLLTNSGLLLLFVVQHSLMSERMLSGSKYWELVHSKWKIDKTIYNFMTGVALQCLIRCWESTPVNVWNIQIMTGNQYFKMIHALAWASLYGSCIMLDLPDLIGLNQVVVSSPTMTVKSPELKRLYQTQRHMGLVPFSVILLVYPYMSLDRLILTVCCITYMYLSWRSNDSYQYASEMRRAKKLRTN